jgi:Na+-driven multidrug efflux pump
VVLFQSFLYAGTTAMIAAAKEHDRVTAAGGNKTSTTMACILKASMQISILTGLLLGSLVFVFAKPLLFGIMGGAGLGADVGGTAGAADSIVLLKSALAYVRIRALAMPAAALLSCAQMASLAMQDVKLPMFLTALAASVNMIGNACLVQRFPMACIGAAWATVLAQYTAVAFFFHWISRTTSSSSSSNSSSISISFLQGEHGKMNYNIREKQFNVERNKSDDCLTATPRSSPSMRGFLAGSVSIRDLLVPKPSWETVRGFTSYFVPVTTTQAGRAATSVAIDCVVASSFGAVGMAANQIITSIYAGLLTPIADSLNLAGQSFAPGIDVSYGNGAAKGRALRRLRNNLLKASGICGVVLMTTLAALTVGTSCQLFTSDPVVVQAVHAVVPTLLVAAAVQGAFSACEGLLLGQKDLCFLTKMYGSYSLAVPFILWQVRKGAQAGSPHATLVSVWQVFTCYAVTRIVLMGGRVVMLSSKSLKRTQQQKQEHHQQEQEQSAIQVQRPHS